MCGRRDSGSYSKTHHVICRELKIFRQLNGHKKTSLWGHIALRAPQYTHTHTHIAGSGPARVHWSYSNASSSSSATQGNVADGHQNNDNNFVWRLNNSLNWPELVHHRPDRFVLHMCIGWWTDWRHGTAALVIIIILWWLVTVLRTHTFIVAAYHHREYK